VKFSTRAVTVRHATGVPSNPKDSKWRSTPQADRKRPLRSFTMDDKTFDALTEFSAKTGQPKSVIVEEAIREYLRKHRK